MKPVNLFCVVAIPGAALAQQQPEPHGLGSQSARARPDRNGPCRRCQDVPLPKHTYSPFDNIGKPPPYTPAPGRDYPEGSLVVKFAPGVRIYRRPCVQLKNPGADVLVALTDNADLNRALAAHGIADLEAVCPNAKPPVQPQSTQGLPTPDLTRWYRAKRKGSVRQAIDDLNAQPGIEPESLAERPASANPRCRIRRGPA